MSDKKQVAQNRILLPKIDVIFKLLFGDKRNSEILIDFLKSVLDIPEDEYTSITLEDTHLKRENVEDKLGIVDVKLTTKSGKIVHIEIQVLELEEMPERITYYNSKMLVTQLKSGSDYDLLKKTISIVIADFDMFKGSPDYRHVFQLYDIKAGIKFTDLIEVNTLELTKIPNNSDNTKVYEWMRFLKAEKEEEFQMIAEKNPVIQKAYVELKRLSQDEEAQLLFEAREKAIRDENSRTRFAINKGKQEGAKETATEIATKLLSKNLTIEEIVEITGLTVEEIQNLRN